MIEFNNLSKVYGRKTALTVNELKINEREFVGVVGNNGAGKTTMLSLILDLIKATTGWVKSKENLVSKTEDWKSYTGSYLNEGFLIPFLTPMEYLEFIANLHGKKRSDVDLFISANSPFFTEDHLLEKYIRDLSAGNKNKVGILASMLPDPEIIILDEPFANLDPGSQAWLKNKLKRLNDSGTTLIVSSHDLHHVTEICTRILVLEDGKIIKDSPVNAFTFNELENYFKK
jgi:ABC-2 type transport system ATP-binding protein